MIKEKMVLDKICLELESTIYSRLQFECENSFCNQEKPDEIIQFARCLLNDIEKWEKGEGLADD